ncbi:MAG: ABC transporter substrate-binding protein [Pseudochelatococcus sp.]|jgi:ABC-type Fe3+-hydroxamate transport system substrate-binding protein|uniref:ABC transporter substrate-binding protein n=1 Tax=Pseudochelatococcus sp. TaxID=2020869 RepID=UPI003D934EFB
MSELNEILNRRMAFKRAVGACTLSLHALFSTRNGLAKIVPGERIAVFDTETVSMLLSIGITPMAMLGKEKYRQRSEFPALPESIISLGTKDVNFELLDQLRPTLIILNEGQAGYPFGHVGASFRGIAPFYVSRSYRMDSRTLVGMRAEFLQLADLVDRRETAERLLAGFDAAIRATRNKLSRHENRPVFLFSFIDHWTIQIFCESGTQHEILELIGLENAYKRRGRYGYVHTGIDALAAVPEAQLVVIGPIPSAARKVMTSNPLWKALPAVKEKRLVELPPLSRFGSVPVVTRLVALLGERLPAGREAG